MEGKKKLTLGPNYTTRCLGPSPSLSQLAIMPGLQVVVVVVAVDVELLLMFFVFLLLLLSILSLRWLLVVLC